MIEPLHALILGIVEGLTEYLPISSTGHLIVASHWLGLHGEGVKTFEVVIQAGAICAVLGLYRRRVGAMWRGLFGRDPDGRRLFGNLVISFVPAMAAGLLLHDLIKERLFEIWPVAAALAAGGLLMIAGNGWLRRRADTGSDLASLDWTQALLIGLAQCLALWPGASRAMLTMVAGMAIGLSPVAAAEYSFLLALPTLGAATALDALHGGSALLREVGALSLLIGFVSAAVVAALAVRGLVRYVTRHGLAVFGWYRVALAAVIWWSLR